MSIKRISISNFKSFDEESVDLGKFTVLIGANASGKSNFIQIFKFLRDLASFGLDNAISMQGGLEYLVNTNLGSSKDFSIEIVLEETEPPTFRSKKQNFVFSAFETCYKFALKLGQNLDSFEIIEDKITQRGKFYRPIKGQKTKTKEELGDGAFYLYRLGDKTKLEWKTPEGIDMLKGEIFEIFATFDLLEDKRLIHKGLLIESPYLLIMGSSLRNTLKNISIYDFDPKLSKKPQTITGRAELEEDGSNLAIAVNNLLKSEIKRKELYNLVSELLPFVQEMKIETFAGTVLFELREGYSKNRFFPAFLISDGTINLTALTVALYFEGKSLTIIEEPERNIHPHLISKVVDMMREVSQKKQIVTTTHNPEVVRHAKPNDILLVSRTKDGNSRVYRPIEKEEIRIFLKEDMGIDELYVQNLLEI
jgi:predicted ATPase